MKSAYEKTFSEKGLAESIPEIEKSCKRCINMNRYYIKIDKLLFCI